MYFDLTDDQRAMQDMMRQFCTDRLPMSTVRGLVERGGVDRALWREIADLGLFGLRVEESAGGAGLGWPDAAILFEELGRACVPGPLVASHLAAGTVPDAAQGGVVVGAVERSPSVMVEHLDALDVLIVIDDDAVRQIDAPSVRGAAVGRPLDPLTPLHLVEDLPAGDRIGDADAVQRWRRGGAVLTAATQVGMAAAVLSLAVSHARDREQFQRPIGSFQAVKHQLADCVVRLDLAQAAVYAAAVGLDDPDADDVDRAISVAKVVAGEAALENAKTSIQVHGAMGFTWEVDPQLYLKRAWVHDTQYGSGSDHARAVASAL